MEKEGQMRIRGMERKGRDQGEGQREEKEISTHIERKGREVARRREMQKEGCKNK